MAGGGPAGSAAALTLARAGRGVLLVEKSPRETFKVGEGLPPAARPLLRQLGLLELFDADSHLPSYGNQSAWGSHVLHTTDFIKDPHGHGWHLDRPRFDAMLRDAARGAGAETLGATRVRKCARTAAGDWRLTLEGAGAPATVRARWVIDCTGRPASVARAEGVGRINYDQLLAFVALFNPPEGSRAPDRNSLTLVESAREGWWYTSLLPGGGRVTVYLTDADTDTAASARTTDGFAALLAETAHVGALVNAHGYVLGVGPKVALANSARLERIVGEGWLAAGDACASYDPLSSQGIVAALYSGFRAGLALDAHASGDAGALEAYERHLRSVYDSYLRHRSVNYGSERRWPESEFWRRRRQQP